MARNANRMQEAVDRLAGTFASIAAVTVTYARGNYTVTLTATVGRTPYQIEDGGVLTAYESRDYIVKAEDLVLKGAVTLPQSADTVTEADGGIFEVSVPKGLNVFESIGPDSTVLKIHTKGIE